MLASQPSTSREVGRLATQICMLVETTSGETSEESINPSQISYYPTVVEFDFKVQTNLFDVKVQMNFFDAKV